MAISFNVTEEKRFAEVVEQYDRLPLRTAPQLLRYRCAEYGHVEVITWLHESKAELCDITLWIACREGQFEVIKRLRSYGCLWSSFLIRAARQRGYREVADWLAANGCPS